MNVGSVISLPTNGRMGVVVGSAAIGETADGKQRVVMQVKSEVAAAESTGRSTPAPPKAIDYARDAAAPPPSRNGYEVREARIARDPNDLTAAEKAAVDSLRQRDAQVRQEEQAHAGAAGAAAGPISYTFATGPDGRQYAAGGSVSVRLSNPSGDPAKFVQAAAKLAAAAHAAHNPSAADLAAARKGYQAAGAALANMHADIHRDTEIVA